MSATEELRKLLDERGIEWDGWGEDATFWGNAIASDYGNGGLWVTQNLTPEQAITTTLGLGTCRMELAATLSDDVEEYRCLSCDEFAYTHLDGEPPKYCPNCGRKVEE